MIDMASSWSAAVRTMRPRRERPRRRAAEQFDELPPPHSITSSARRNDQAAARLASELGDSLFDFGGVANGGRRHLNRD
jgi:broad specificity phosphatase PhoE